MTDFIGIVGLFRRHQCRTPNGVPSESLHDIIHCCSQFAVIPRRPVIQGQLLDAVLYFQIPGVHTNQANRDVFPQEGFHQFHSFGIDHLYCIGGTVHRRPSGTCGEIRLTKFYRDCPGAGMILPEPLGNTLGQFQEGSFSDGLRIKPGAHFEYFARKVTWDETSQILDLKSTIFALNLEIAINDGFSVSAIAGYSLSDYDSLIFREISSRCS